MSRLSTERAREIVNGIRELNGGLSAEDRRNTSESVLRVLENVLRQLGSSTRTIANGLYSSESRFVLELIQNAEDNSYEHIRDGAPFIKFTLMPGKIVVENNEDGFNEADVRSICKVNDSTKVNRLGYIGEKGIGFKSVFQVAQKVQIQSGPFNFSFEHRPEDSGMGMITPMNEKDTPTFYNGTRITLSLLHFDEFDKRENDLFSIPDALILFLPKLQRIELLVQREDNSSCKISYECEDSSDNSTINLIKNIDGEISVKFFHVERRTFYRLPSDNARRNRNGAEVTLAFPITDDSRPIIEPQRVFSFLPIRDFGFKFIIQSDFITAASREDIRSCLWNSALLKHVSTVFLSAVNKFCTYPILQYDWLCFLPGPDITHEFWNRLHDMIITLLRDYPILLTRGGVNKSPAQLVLLSNMHCDRHGEPLFKDLRQEAYLSAQYRPAHIGYLRALGVRDITWETLIPRLEPYLQGEDPQFLHEDQDEDWHTRVASLLMRGLESSSARSIRNRIRELPLIPLRDGSLSNNLQKKIYFPTDMFGNHIPADLRLKVVDENALEDCNRKSLYEILGVEKCDPSLVQDRISKRYNPPRDINLSKSIAHLKYLYQTLPDDKELNNCIFVMSQSMVPIYRILVPFGRPITVDDLYFDTSGEFGTRHLAMELQSDEGLSGIHLLHDAYLEAVSSHEELENRPWKRWLKKKALIRRVPRLGRKSSSRISHLFTRIINYKPQLLVGTLKRYWSSYEDEKTQPIVETIRNAEVPCIDTDTQSPLKATYLPTLQLTAICNQACLRGYFNLFLHLSTSSGVTETPAGYEFLEEFGVGTKPDLNFFSDILSALTENITGQDLKTGLFYIYEQIFEEFHANDGERISEILDELSAVCIPRRIVQTTTLENCVWNGLPSLHVKDCLSQYAEYAENARVRFLFQDILDLRDADCRTYLDELKYLQRTTPAGQLSFDNICAIYAEFLTATENDEDWEFVRNEFEEHELIYIPTEQNEAWVAPTSCVWTEASNVGRQYGIEAIYSNLANLFTENLHIQTPTIATYVEQLELLAAQDSPSVAEIKHTINCINELSPTRNSLKGLRQLICLPVHISGAEIRLMRPSDVFFVADRREYEKLFREKVPVLDFSLEEIHAIYPFLTALRLTDRYMSVVVQETTMVRRRSESPSTSLSQVFRAKSKAFFRCALHYRSSKVQTNGQEVYHKFRQALIYESDGFTKHLRLSYGDLTVNAVSDRGIFHLEDVHGTLILFVPRDDKQREKCYLTQLPNALERYLLIDNPGASKVFLLVIQASRHVLDDVLDEDGIVRIPESDLRSFERAVERDSLGEEIYVDISIERPDSSSDTTYESVSEEPINNRPNRSPSTSFSVSNEIQSITSHSRSSSSYVAVDRAELLPEPASLTAGRHSDGLQNDPLASLTQASTYVRILDTVIVKARRTRIPSFYARIGTSSAAAGISREEHVSAFGVRSQNQLAHDIKIGAAGELFVFEMLLNMGLPGFGRDNWKSNIRKEVCVHPAYHNLAPWNEAEVSDISYKDSASVLTRIMIDNGYLPGSRWQGATPEYLIEVKSTTGAWESAFFMSKSQYRRMQSHKLNPRLTVPESTIYVIFRVYNLGKENMHLRVYVDPESLQQQNYLKFTPESYRVTVPTMNG
ncbi:hypothetical protein BGW36DRAFT_289384 [Talaromyces proteolyticus]|uniref:Protein NO VEIN C-terminal domain-containing protein n=1 Tax=Talaromyces proteolyticus TaxID=1131652 RepID=A0AAD4KVY2_9EURO|nr:uncharacterized protein BGW36DRAFT_289384 [Talaromyces proteolyticus]KAH8702222.1 hypothetical protein BGW36DRAFT_289384 [Talaromyces proteolyticus]